jgi:Tfp pilus assembly protein PilF
MAKQMLVTLPFVLLLLDYWPLNRLKLPFQSNAPGGLSVWNAVREKIPLFVLAAISSVTIYLVQQGGGAMSTRDLLPLGARISNALVSYVVYIEKTVWPSGLAIFYPHPGNTLTLMATGGAALLLAIVTGFVLLKGRQFPYLIVGWFWYVGTLVPVIGLVQVGIQARADRYTYLPIIGLFIMAAWGLPDLLSGLRNRKTILAAGATIIIGSCLFLTATQAGYWKDNSSVFGHAVEVVDNNFLAHNDLGSALEKRGEIDLAISHYREAIRLKPDFVLAQSNLGAALGRQGKYPEAIEHLQEAIRLKPDHADAHNNLGIVYAIQGKDADAMREFSEALRIDPDQADAHFNLGILLARSGKLEEAVRHYLKALEINPGQENARTALAEARALQNKK